MIMSSVSIAAIGELVAAVVPFLKEALECGGVAIVVATGAHRLAFDAALRSYGLPVDELAAGDRYLSFDAADALSGFVRDGRLDRPGFNTVVGPLLDRAQAQAAGGPVRVFGEMVGLLWDDGDVAAAIELESMWNDLAADHDVRALLRLRDVDTRDVGRPRCGQAHV